MEGMNGFWTSGNTDNAITTTGNVLVSIFGKGQTADGGSTPTSTPTGENTGSGGGQISDMLNSGSTGGGTQKKSSTMKWVIGGVVVAAVVGVIIMIKNKSKEE